MKRYAICDVIGDGQDVEPTATTGPFRAAVADCGIPCTQMLGYTPEGLPAKPWALVILSANDLAPLRGDSRIYLLPDLSLDVKVSAMDGSVRAAMVAEFSRRDIPSAIVSGADGYRELIRALGHIQDPAFSEDAFDVAEA